jgi:hypothetical protein
MYIGNPDKNNIKTAHENILAIFDVFREYGVFEQRYTSGLLNVFE